MPSTITYTLHLAQPAAEFRSAKSEVVAQHIQQRSGGVQIKRMSLAIHLEGNRAHMLSRYDRRQPPSSSFFFG